MAAWMRTTLLCLMVYSATYPTPLTAQNSAPIVSLAGQYHDGIALQDYWISEKLDGVRAYWNGEELLARSGNVIQAPVWFLEPLPDAALDGELWLGRERFDALSGIVRQAEPNDADWRQIRFMIFDMPQAAGIFAERLETMQKLLAHNHTPWLQLVPQFKANDEADLLNTLNNVVSVGGEGLMLRRSNANYHGLRNDDLLKLKPLYDAEATVIEHLPGKGRLLGMMGSLLVETPAGVRFRLGTGFSDEERRNPPSLGSIVTYQYSGLTSRGLPRFARYLRVRNDP